MSEDSCASGREAKLGGRWFLPCLNQPARNVLAFTDDGAAIVKTLRFCDQHIGQLIDEGRVDHPAPTFQQIRKDR